MLEGTYTEISQSDALFEFNGIQYNPKHFFHNGKKTGFTDELLKFANDSAEKWHNAGLLLTAYIPSCWGGMTDAQRNMIYPKLGIMWTSLDGSTDESIPSWIDTAAGYRPIVKQITATKVLLLKDEYLNYYFLISTEPAAEPEPETPKATENIYHIHHYIHLVRD